jgi:hypothetical protein
MSLSRNLKYTCCNYISFHFTLQETLRKELDDAHAVTQSLKKDTERLNEETRTSDEDAAILEKNRYVIAFPLLYMKCYCNYLCFQTKV